MLVINTSSPGETAALGEKMAPLLRRGDILCLNGDLGAGKTKFAQGLAKGIGVEGPVNSPTFTLINEYDGVIPFYHMDIYRLNEPRELEDLGYEEYFFGEGVTLLEWADKVGEMLPEERLDIYIYRRKEGSDEREIKFFPRGNRYLLLVEELRPFVRAGN